MISDYSIDVIGVNITVVGSVVVVERYVVVVRFEDVIVVEVVWDVVEPR